MTDDQNAILLEIEASIKEEKMADFNEKLEQSNFISLELGDDIYSYSFSQFVVN